MQAFNSVNNSIELFTNTAKKPNQTSKKDNKDGGEFLSMVLNAASSKASKGEAITEKDVKEIVQSVSMQNEQLKKTEEITNLKISENLANQLDEATKNELYENANFMQLLQVLEILNGGEQVSKFPNFTDKIASFLSNIANVKELSEIKSVSELIDLAKKFDLGLENLQITQDDVENLSQMFKNLGKNEFFTPVLPPQPKVITELKSQVEQNLAQTTNQEEPAIKLNELLKEVSKPVAETKQQVAQPPTQVQNQVENITKQTATETVTKQIVDESLKQVISDEPETAQPQQPTTNNLNLKENKEQKLTLQTLLYPEREQTMSEGSENLEQDSGQNELNSMVRDIAKQAQNQVQNRLAVRETLSNFSQNLAEQVANYKAPFTRVNITLNPLNLGEVEITMVNRGNNLHINFNSTTTTMNLFLQNQAEFKNSLVNMGFTELEMNFSDQQQKQEKGQKTYKNLAQNENFEENGEEQTSLELVIPRYI